MSLTDLRSLTRPVDETLSRMQKQQVVKRLWQKDHTLWNPEPHEIVDRLGWLDLVGERPEPDAELAEVVRQVHSGGLTDAVLLGMGGSSLGAEALRASFGELQEGLRLHVLDSTHPRWVESIRRQIDPEKTVFLVASKSGTTAEVMAFFDYFWSETEAIVGDATGWHFIAITDPGSPLVDLAQERGFRHTFLNPSDIGGRFSVLSRFGLVSAALAGIDTEKLLERGHEMAEQCRPGIAPAENPGLWLGAVLGAGAHTGRYQLTLLTSPRLASFGLWAEQLIAESTGKEGKGVLPIAEEPMTAIERYGDERLFVALRLRDDNSGALDERLQQLAAAGHPVVDIELADLYDLGAEFFRWEMATAVAGHLLGIHPFDQPDVQATKAETHKVLEAFKATGKLPQADADSDLSAALAEGRPAYVAIMAYAKPTDAFESNITRLCQLLLERFDVGVTFGYGPRFLHSTGQLHKGGPDGGLFIQLLTETDADLAIPGGAFGFGTLVQAQAAGDLAALRSNGRRVVRVDLGDRPAEALGQWVAKLSR